MVGFVKGRALAGREDDLSVPVVELLHDAGEGFDLGNAQDQLVRVARVGLLPLGQWQVVPRLGVLLHVHVVVRCLHVERRAQVAGWRETGPN